MLLLLPASDGTADWWLLLALSAIIYAVIITVQLVLSGDIGQYYCFLQLPAASLLVNPDQLVETAGE